MARIFSTSGQGKRDLRVLAIMAQIHLFERQVKRSAKRRVHRYKFTLTDYRRGHMEAM